MTSLHVLLGSQKSGHSLNTFVLALMLISALSHQAAQAHNGAIAFAYPLTNIIVDGDLSDWPSDLTRYPLEKFRVGVPAENKSDLSAHFRIAFDSQLNKILIAVEVLDQSILLDSADYVNWDTHDGIELYLDPAHLLDSSAITQYSEYGPERLVFGQNRSWADIEMNMVLTPQGRNYEWAIHLDRSVTPGISLAMDLVVIDKDEDDSYSWLAWGEHSQKLNSPDRCGDLVLVDPKTRLSDVSGSVDMSKMLSGPLPLPVRFEHQDHSRLWVQTVSDSTGDFQLQLPAGAYRAHVPQEMMRVGDDFYRMASNQPVTMEVGGNTHASVKLCARQIPPPDLFSDRGLMFDFRESDQQRVDHFIETYQEYYDIPGISLALIKNGEVAYHKTYGVKSTKTNDPVDAETLFEAASITKPVFGFLVLRMAEKEIIDLDKPLFEYLPFDELEVTPEYKKMTARHVLTHRSGLPNWGIPLINTPGTKYGYSGEGFEYLKRVVCKITGKDIERLLKEEVLDPLDLYHMEFKDSEALREVAAIGHQGSNPTYWSIPEEPGMAHSMHTEAKAFSKFAIALLKENGLNASTFKEMVKIFTEAPKEHWNHKDHREGAGLGVHIRESPDGKVIGHGGNNGDFKCLFEVYQDLDMGYVVFTNSSMGDCLAGDLAEFLVEGKAKSK